jgi:hypothetical protein
MKECTGANYQSSKYAKMLAVADAKVGKSSSLVAGCLGMLPWQSNGAVVDKPENLHIITTDSNALGHLRQFLTGTCKAPESALAYRVYDMEEDYRRTFREKDAYSSFFYNTLMTTIQKVQERATIAKGASVLILSSLTTMGRALQRGVSGPVQSDGQTVKKSTMDKSKWPMFNMQLNELQAFAQADMYHCIWEGHLAKKLDFTNKDENGQPEEKDSIQLQGSVGASWAANVEQVVVMQRTFGSVHPGTKCDKTSFNTRPSLNMVASGRGFTELLEKSEPCITTMFEKLGLRVGKWKPTTPSTTTNQP